MSQFNVSHTKLYAAFGITAVIVIGAVITWKSSVIEHVATGMQLQSFTVDCEFERFRQIMVRKNATAAIVAHSGMKLLDESVQDIAVDTSVDDRPLLNAIRGKSKSDLSAKKLLTVQLDDPTLEASKLALRQVAEIRVGKIDVKTSSMGPAGRLESYSTSLHAQPQQQSTNVTVSVEMKVRVAVPKLLVSRADKQVQQAADDAIDEQVKAITHFIAQHADERLILPELGNR